MKGTHSSKRAAVFPTAVFIVCFIGIHWNVLPSYAESTVLLPGLGSPHMIDIMNDELYVLDDVHVTVFSLKDFKKKREFGKRGEGPGEMVSHLELPLVMTTREETVFIKSMNKVLWFTPDGQLKKEAPMKYMSIETVPVGNKIGAFKVVSGRDGIQRFTVLLHDTQTGKIQDLYTAQREHPLKIKRIEMPQFNIILRSTEDLLFVFDMYKGFHIEKFTAEGKRLEPIILDEPEVTIDKAHRKNAMKWFSQQRLYKSISEKYRQYIRFPENFPACRNFLINNGKLFIFTYKVKDNRNEIMVLDFNGKLIKRSFAAAFEPYSFLLLTERRFAVHKGKLYVLRENSEEEEWELAVMDI